MPYSICCGAYTNMEEYGICPECLEHTEFYEEDDKEQEDIDSKIEEQKINKLNN